MSLEEDGDDDDDFIQDYEQFAVSTSSIVLCTVPIRNNASNSNLLEG